MNLRTTLAVSAPRCRVLLESDSGQSAFRVDFMQDGGALIVRRLCSDGYRHMASLQAARRVLAAALSRRTASRCFGMTAPARMAAHHRGAPERAIEAFRRQADALGPFNHDAEFPEGDAEALRGSWPTSKQRKHLTTLSPAGWRGTRQAGPGTRASRDAAGPHCAPRERRRAAGRRDGSLAKGSGAKPGRERNRRRDAADDSAAQPRGPCRSDRRVAP